MKIFVGSDHVGFGHKSTLIPYLISMGHEVEDKGAEEYVETDDYPDFVLPVAREVSKWPNEVRGIIFGGSGQGEAMCANKLKYVRAAVYYGGKEKNDSDGRSIVQLSREHNNSNILSIGARFVSEDEMKEVVKEWLDTPFSEDPRHIRRIDKVNTAHE